MARTGYLPEFLSKLNVKFKTPHYALIVPGVIAVVVALSGLTSVVITISVFSALFMYILATLSVFILHKKEPNMERPYKVAYPITPIISVSSHSTLQLSSGCCWFTQWRSSTTSSLEERD